jgi:2-aminoethylphosphonate dioxygenase
MNAATPRAMLAETALCGAAAEHYRRHGWTHARGFFTHAEMVSIVGYVDQVAALPEISGRQMVYREPSLLDPNVRVLQRIEDFCPQHPLFDALVRGGRLQAAIERLFGEPAVLFKDKINFKMPGGAGFEPHQDQAAGWSRYAPLFITAMISVDAATVENGCLEIAAGPRLRHLIGPEWEPLSSDVLKHYDLRPAPTRPGDAMFFDSYVPHASDPNLTQSTRRVLYLTYNRAADGDQRARYYADKRAAFPPDIDRQPSIDYRFRV